MVRSIKPARALNMRAWRTTCASGKIMAALYRGFIVTAVISAALIIGVTKQFFPEGFVYGSLDVSANDAAWVHHRMSIKED